MKKHLLALAIFFALVLSLSGCGDIIRIDPAPPSDSSSSESSEPSGSSDSSESSVVTDPAPTAEEAEALIEKQLFVLWGKKDLNELTDGEKLWVAFSLCDETGIDYTPEGEQWGGVPTRAYSEDGIRKAFERSCLALTGVKMGDFETGGVGFIYVPEDHLFFEGGGKGYYPPECAYTRVVSAESSGDTLTYQVKKLWIPTWPGDYSICPVFGTYNDAYYDYDMAGNDGLYSVEVDTSRENWYDTMIEDAAAAAEAGWSEYEDRAETYTFVFQNQNGRILLTDFSCEAPSE